MNPDDYIRNAMGLPPNTPAAEKGVQVHMRSIDGVKYVRLEDVCALLDANHVLPGISTKFRDNLRRTT